MGCIWKVEESHLILKDTVNEGPLSLRASFDDVPGGVSAVKNYESAGTHLLWFAFREMGDQNKGGGKSNSYKWIIATGIRTSISNIYSHTNCA